MVRSSLKDEPKTKNPKINANNEEKKCFKHFRLKTHIKLTILIMHIIVLVTKT